MFYVRKTFIKAGKDSGSASDMLVAGFTSFFVIIWSAGAAKDGGDDEWVHLPDKCEGKRVQYQPRSQKNGTQGPPVVLETSKILVV